MQPRWGVGRWVTTLQVCFSVAVTVAVAVALREHPLLPALRWADAQHDEVCHMPHHFMTSVSLRLPTMPVDSTLHTFVPLYPADDDEGGGDLATSPRMDVHTRFDHASFTPQPGSCGRTVVTAMFDTESDTGLETVHGVTTPQPLHVHTARAFNDTYWPWFRAVLRSRVPMIIHVAPADVDRVIAARCHLLDVTEIVATPPSFPRLHTFHRHVQSTSQRFVSPAATRRRVVQAVKVHLLQDAATRNPFDATHVFWVDGTFGHGRVFAVPALAQAFPGCLPVQRTMRMHPDAGPRSKTHRVLVFGAGHQPRAVRTGGGVRTGTATTTTTTTVTSTSTAHRGARVQGASGHDGVPVNPDMVRQVFVDGVEPLDTAMFGCHVRTVERLCAAMLRAFHFSARLRVLGEEGALMWLASQQHPDLFDIRTCALYSPRVRGSRCAIRLLAAPF